MISVSRQGKSDICTSKGNTNLSACEEGASDHADDDEANVGPGLLLCMTGDMASSRYAPRQCIDQQGPFGRPVKRQVTEAQISAL